MAICEVMAFTGCIIYYFKYHEGEYRPIDVIFLAIILGSIAAGLAIGLSKIIRKMFHVEDGN